MHCHDAFRRIVPTTYQNTISFCLRFLPKKVYCLIQYSIPYKRTHMKYKRSQLRSLILSALSKGELAVGDQLPTEPEMIQKYRMSRATIREGIALLVEEGILSRRRGSGTFVSRLRPAPKGKMVAALIKCQYGGLDSFGLIAREIEQRVHEQGNALILCNESLRAGSAVSSSPRSNSPVTKNTICPLCSGLKNTTSPSS